ncbi:MAG: hypothetical protein AAGA73_04845 [Pseudomonadota bacterium]
MHPLRTWGCWSVLIGALALVFAQLVGPTFESRPSAATQIGKIAGEIKRSAWRTLLGLPAPERQIRAASVWSYLAIIAPLLGLIAVSLSLISAVLRENWRYPVYGVSLGVTAIVFQFLWWLAACRQREVITPGDTFQRGIDLNGLGRLVPHGTQLDRTIGFCKDDSTKRHLILIAAAREQDRTDDG